jgi:hypothetical protein
LFKLFSNSAKLRLRTASSARPSRAIGRPSRCRGQISKQSQCRHISSGNCRPTSAAILSSTRSATRLK